MTDHEVALKIQYDDDSHETAEVHIRGLVQSVDRQFILDTGCAKTVLALDDFSSGLKTVGSKESSGIFGRSEFDLVNVESLKIGPIQIRAVAVSRARAGGTDRNLLGMDVLRNHRIQFCFAQSKIEVDGEIPTGTKLNDLFLDDGGIPYVDVACGNSTGRAVWDSGAGITLVDLAFLQKNAANFTKMGESTGTDSTGESRETPTYWMKGAKIAGITFRPHVVVGVDLAHVNASNDHPMDFILGFSTLRQAHWLFDFPRRQWGICKFID